MTDEPEKQLKQLPGLISYISSRIPGCKDLESEYCDCWTNRDNSSPEELEDIRQRIGEYVNNWLRQTDEREIVETVQYITAGWRKVLYDIVSSRYQNFFESDYKGFPNSIAVPCPFLLFNRTAGTVSLSRPHIIKYGKTTIKIQGLGPPQK